MSQLGITNSILKQVGLGVPQNFHHFLNPYDKQNGQMQSC